MIEQASLVIGEGNWAVKSDSLLGYKINGGKYYPREMSVVRATTGTRINEDGLVELVPYNLLQQSSSFDNAYWTKVNLSISANQIAAPDGTLTADLITVTNNLAFQEKTFVSGNLNFLPNTQYTFSAYYKQASVNEQFRILVYDGSTVLSTNFIDLTNPSASGVPFENVGNGWYRFIYTFTTTASASTGYMYGVNWSYVDAVPSGTNIYQWGAQLVEGSSALDYLPTTDRLDVARIDYSSGSGALLVEPQRTNLVTYSSSFDNAAWTKNGATVTANTATSPDGTTNADTLEKVGGSGGSDYFYIVSGIGSNTTNTGSFFVKYKEGSGIIWLLGKNSNTFAYFNVQTGTALSASAGMTTKIENYGNGWYRCSFTQDYTGGGTTFGIGLCLVDGTPNYNATNATTQGAYIWGAQVELGSYSTSYIPTTSASVTRNADVISKTGISSLIGQTEGTIFWDIDVDILSASGHEDIFNIDNGSGFGQTIYLTKSSTGILVAEVYVGATVQCSISYSLPSVGRYKMALAYKANDFAFYVNGVSRGTDSSGTVPATSRFQLGNGALGPSTGYTNAAALWKTRLTNAELATLTTI